MIGFMESLHLSPRKAVRLPRCLVYAGVAASDAGSEARRSTRRSIT